ncbi:MAG: FAD-dependent oxidoreductase, partial [Angelakisella sp.]
KELCEKLDVERKEIGSFVLAFSDSELATVEALYERGNKNGVPDLQLLNKAQVLELEPNLSHEVMGALYAPSAAIVNPWEFAIALAETAVKNGVEVHLSTKVEGIVKGADGFTVSTDNGVFN